MATLELDDVDVDERHVASVLQHRVAGGVAHLLEVVGEVSGRESAVEGEVGALDGLPVLVEQRVEDRFLVGEVMVDVAGGHLGAGRDVAYARGPVPLGGEQLESCVEDLLAGPL